MTNIRNITGEEILRDFAESVYTVALESRAQVSKRTGSLAQATKITRAKDGFAVSVTAPRLRSESGLSEFYAKKYMLDGYKSIPAFNYIDSASKVLEDDRMTSLSAVAVPARNPSYRKGSGVGTNEDIGRDILENWIKTNSGKVRWK